MLKTKNYNDYNADDYDKKIKDMTVNLSVIYQSNYFMFEKIPFRIDLLKGLTSKSEKTQAHQNRIFFPFNPNNTFGILIGF